MNDGVDEYKTAVVGHVNQMVLRDSPGGSDMVPFSNRHWQNVCKMISRVNVKFEKLGDNTKKQKIGILFSNTCVWVPCTLVPLR